jgi:replicative DNA helicase
MTTQISDLPHDLLAEKSLIGCLLIDGQSFDSISDLKLKKIDFFDPRCGMIYEAVADLALSNRPIDFVTVCSKLVEMGKLDECGGESGIYEIIQDEASSANIYHYGKTIKQKAAVREIVREAQRVAYLGKSYKGDPDDYIQEVESAFFKLTNEAKGASMMPLKLCLRENLKELEDTSRKPGDINGLKTGYKELDKLLLGMKPGQLIVLAARPAMGKTSLACNIAVQSCLEAGKPIALFSLEMLGKELSMRLLSSRARVDSKRIQQKNFLDTDLRNIARATNELSKLPIFINDSADSNLLDIQSQCRKIKSEQGLGLIVIDYLQLMSSHVKVASREQEISNISRGLKNMAKELECPVIALSQLNRSVESRPNKRPNSSDLRESGAIEQDADIIMFVYRDEVYNPDTKEPGVAEIIVSKNRSGETGTAKLAWIGAYTSFENLSYSSEGTSAHQ